MKLNERADELLEFLRTLGSGLVQIGVVAILMLELHSVPSTTQRFAAAVRRPVSGKPMDTRTTSWITIESVFVVALYLALIIGADRVWSVCGAGVAARGTGAAESRQNGAGNSMTRLATFTTRYAVSDRGLAQFNKGEFDKAIEYCTEAIHLHSNLADTLAGGAAWSRKREFDKALADYTEAIRLNPKFAGPGIYGAERRRRSKKAISTERSQVRRAIRLNPNLAGAFNNRALAWSDKGEHREGHRRLQRGHSTQPQTRRGL